ncbi:MAG TPA: phage tail sheath subtilisin-like domain-containing protein [Caldilineaceae bacterium]|nr:phage tail sheath subtilisin-like domain-containing protein [Caldilineaceae bacterium]
MPEYLSPGVYVEEVDRGPKPIQGVGTAMACFVGFTEKAQIEREIDGERVVEDLLNKPQLVTNWSQYVERFGGLVQGAYLPHAVYGYFLNGGTRCYVLSVKTIPKAQASLLGTDGKPYLTVQAKQAGFDGLKLRVRVDAPEPPKPAATPSAKGKADGDAKGETKTDGAEAGATPPSSASKGGPLPFTVTVERQGPSGGWQIQEVLPDVQLVEVSSNGSKKVVVAYKNNKGSKLVDLLVPEGETAIERITPRSQEQSLSIQRRLIAPAEYADFQGDVMERSGVEGLAQFDDITMLCVPDLMTTMPGQSLDLEMVKAVQTMMIAHCEQMGDRVAILDSPPNMNPQEIKKWRMETAGFDSSYAALYYPWIEVMDPVTNRPMYVPPSGHMAGVWARSDNTRGVHKAPANEVVRGVTNLSYVVTKGEQDTLNPIGINCIRAFPGMGYRVWGARTLSSDPAWRYINVRRLFNYIEKSLQLGTMWTVFEPNDQRLWNRIRRDVTSFLMGVYSQGALFGATPAQAFYVKVDEELNPPHQRDLGQLVIEIGIAPVKPAEFVIFRISQWSAEAA